MNNRQNSEKTTSLPHTKTSPLNSFSITSQSLPPTFSKNSVAAPLARNLSPNMILTLQRKIGNSRTRRLLATGSVVSSPNIPEITNASSDGIQRVTDDEFMPDFQAAFPPATTTVTLQEFKAWLVNDVKIAWSAIGIEYARLRLERFKDQLGQNRGASKEESKEESREEEEVEWETVYIRPEDEEKTPSRAPMPSDMDPNRVLEITIETGSPPPSPPAAAREREVKEIGSINEMDAIDINVGIRALLMLKGHGTLLSFLKVAHPARYGKLTIDELQDPDMYDLTTLIDDTETTSLFKWLNENCTRQSFIETYNNEVQWGGGGDYGTGTLYTLKTS